MYDLTVKLGEFLSDAKIDLRSGLGFNGRSLGISYDYGEFICLKPKFSDFVPELADAGMGEITWRLVDAVSDSCNKEMDVKYIPEGHTRYGVYEDDKLVATISNDPINEGWYYKSLGRIPTNLFVG